MPFPTNIFITLIIFLFKTREKDTKGNPVYLSDIMESVKKHTGKEINKAIGKQGHFWQKESFDTTIRDREHMYNAIRYTLNNPVAAGLVSDWTLWPGSWVILPRLKIAGPLGLAI